MGFFNWFKRKKNVEAKVEEVKCLSAKEIINEFICGNYPYREIALNEYALRLTLLYNDKKACSSYIDDFKKIYPDVMIRTQKYKSEEYVEIYFKTGPRTWTTFDGRKTFDGLNNLFKYFDEEVLECVKYEERKENKTEEIRIYGLCIGSVIEKRNLKLNEYFLNNEKFLELKNKNFFGINEVHVTPFGPLFLKYKLTYYYDYFFVKKDLFDPCFTHKFGKEELNLDMEELLDQFYISKIYYLDEDENGNAITKVIENMNAPVKAYDIIKKDLMPKLNENKIKDMKTNLNYI